VSNTRSAHLRWTGDGEVFEGHGASGDRIPIDGDMEKGLSPTEVLLLALAACMAIDIRMILEKGRVVVEQIETDVEGERRREPPRYFEKVHLNVRLRGPSSQDESKIERAVQLSRDKYCSVLHTLRPDLELSVAIERF